MPNHMPGSARYVQTRMTTPVATNSAAAASWRGSSMQPHRSTPLLPMSTYNVSGKGTWSLTETTPPGDPRFPRGPRISGRQGTLDLSIVGGAAATATILTLVDTVTSVAAVTIGVTAGVFQISIRDNMNVVQAAAATTSVGSMVTGVTSRIQVAWSATLPVDGGRFVKILVDGALVPAADFTTEPVAPWTHLQPTQCNLLHAFNGDVLSLQASKSVVL